MSKLNIDQKTIGDLLGAKKADFLIPDYQRPYAWTKDECETLWEDLFAFAFPDGNCDAFDGGEYFLGPIVTFRNDQGQLEVIDGQQRLTTVMLLLRAFYSKFSNMKDDRSIKTSEALSKCIWKTDEFGTPDKSQLKIDSEVASDSDKGEFLAILRSGVTAKEQKSKYADTFHYYEKQIDSFISEYPSYTAYFPTRIMNNVILLPIEAESQDTALRIFSTLNDRGLPLSDADIFKSQFYKFFSSLGRKDEFISRWKRLEALADSVFSPQRGTPMDELFTRYMYYERALQRNTNTTTQALRDFYGKDEYALLKREETLDELETLADFWESVDAQTGFSQAVCRQLLILKYSPNGMWTYLLSVYYLSRREKGGCLDDGDLERFLKLVIGFTFAYAIERPGVNALRGPVYTEMVNLIDGNEVTFSRYRFDADGIRERFKTYVFTNQRPVTRSILAWRAFSDDRQKLIDSSTVLEVEHIYPRRRNDDQPLQKSSNFEALGNKAMIEKGVNVRASDYRFQDKKKYYLGYRTDKGVEKPGTVIFELVDFAKSKEDFTERDIENRTAEIIESFVDYLGSVGLLKS